ncbi:MAG TPA: UDP-N-acetylmuramate dehydrogenase [Gemmatimonadaceae bacterium]|jgi:UDP-N-acetylmuramate dehydrogenase|nr:UDP-N-acetylmuramate dehydrogenase [Gemmatimonadaceae bacterium]
MSPSPSSTALAELATTLGTQRVRRNVALAPYTTFHVGGPADLWYEATSAEELAAAVSAARRLEVPFFLLGLGANILVGDGGFRGLVIRNAAAHWTISDTGQLRAETGVVIAELIRQVVARGWSGLEHFAGIPSTMGGALWQNLHFLSPAPERERTVFIAELFESVDVLLDTGVRRTWNSADMRFGYDTSRLHEGHAIALETTLHLTRGTPETMHRIIQENLSWRGARHPHLDWYPSAGSIFQKLDGLGAGRLIDQAGLKGHQIGGAQISPLHANIIVNLGDATARDVQALIHFAQQTVEQKFGVHLKPEIGFVGEF